MEYIRGQDDIQDCKTDEDITLACKKKKKKKFIRTLVADIMTTADGHEISKNF